MVGGYGGFKMCTEQERILLEIDEQVVKTVNNSTRFYYIGAERSNIKISEDGVLHFAVNDIVLTQDVIADMMGNNLYQMLTQTEETMHIPDLLKKEQKNFYDISLGKTAEGSTHSPLPSIRGRIAISVHCYCKYNRR